MLTHVKVMAALFIAFGALFVLGAFVVLLVFGAGAASAGLSGEPDAQMAIPIIGLAGTGLAIFLLVLGVPGVITGIGLLKLKPWARIVGIVLCAINLINIPFGTLLGLYGLWVLLNSETERLFATATPAGT
jgi:hypothetical protein